MDGDDVETSYWARSGDGRTDARGDGRGQIFIPATKGFIVS